MRSLATILLIVLLLALIAAPLAAQTKVTLTATDSKSISPAGQNWNDNRFRAYWSSGFVDGFVKFDLSSIPDAATILSLTMTTYHEDGFGNPYNNPEVRVYRVGNDSWARGATDPHPGLNEPLTGIHTGFPSGPLVPWDWVLDVGAANWSVDLTDDTLTLALRNEAGNVGRYSYVYWHGADPTPAPPILEVEYQTGLTISPPVPGTAGGRNTVSFSGAAANATVALVFGFAAGSTPVPRCPGLFVAIQSPVLAGTTTASGSGSGSFAGNVPGGQSGKTFLIQAVDVTSCQVSNLVTHTF